MRRVAGPGRGERSSRLSGASKALSSPYGGAGGERSRGPNASRSKREPCSLVREEPEREIRPSRSRHGEGNKLLPQETPLSRRRSEGSRTISGYGGGHATKARHGTGETRLGSRRRAKTEPISRRRKGEEPSGSPRGS